MKTRFVLNDTDELNVILERAFANISNPLAAEESAWQVLEKALAEAYSLGSGKAALLALNTHPQLVFRGAA